MISIDNLLNSITGLKNVTNKNLISVIKTISDIRETVQNIFHSRYYLFAHDDISYGGGLNDLVEMYGDLDEAIKSCSSICTSVENVYVYDILLRKIVYRRKL